MRDDFSLKYGGKKEFKMWSGACAWTYDICCEKKREVEYINYCKRTVYNDKKKELYLWTGSTIHVVVGCGIRIDRLINTNIYYFH